MIRMAFQCLVLLIVSNLLAQNIAINGKVTNQGGKAIYGAIVSLKSKQLSDTTDESGLYSLTAMVSGVNDILLHSPDNTLSLGNGIFTVNLTNPAQVNIEYFGIHGKLLNKTLYNHKSAGIYQIDMNKHPLVNGIMLVRVSIGQYSACFKYSTFIKDYRGNIIQGISSSRLTKMQASVDSIQASALGYKAQKLPVTSYEGKVDIILESEDVGQCTPSKTVNMTDSGSGPHKVLIETNTDAGINEGTIYRPADLGPGKKFPIFVWGEGACSKDGKSNWAAMAEIASYGYFVIADGTPGGSGTRPMNGSDVVGMGKPLIAYINWAIAVNRKPCSAYYQSLDTTKIGANGFSCGGLLSMGTAHDRRTTTWGLTSSGSFSDNRALWNSVHTPVLIIEGSKDVPPTGTGAYTNGLRDYNGIAPLGHPIMFFSDKNAGHGGDLWAQNGGNFTKINLAWLNWWLKGDTGLTGKGALVGSGCKYCKDSNWEVKSANLP